MKRKYSCMYRKIQSKKHKTWDNDGYLLMEEQNWILFDENDKEIQRCAAKSVVPEPGVELRLSGVEIQVYFI